jgi:amino acid adenylation domain-containing protein
MSGYLVQHYLDRAHLSRRGKVAAVSGGLTYDELYRGSNRLAHALGKAGVRRQDRVAIVVGRSCNILLAICGVLKADAIYVPIAHDGNEAKARENIKDCMPKVLLCEASTLEKAKGLARDFGPAVRLGVLDRKDASTDDPEGGAAFWWDQVEAEADSEPVYRNIDTDLAYILYTSGSTGKQKGVMISHLNILNYIEWAVSCFAISESDVILATAPFYFDMSTFDLFCALKSGAKLCIADRKNLLFPSLLFDLIEKEGVTLWKGASSLLAYVAQNGSLEGHRIGSLRKILFGGEVLPTKFLIRWMTAYPEKSFYNVYGPTEATGISAYYRVEKIPENDQERIPIGKACENTEILILKEDGSPARVGETGEIVIRGSGLSRGYWGDGEGTQKAFPILTPGELPEDRVHRTGDLGSMREDGQCLFLGRKDHQIKHMGYRFNLREVEEAMLSLPMVRDAAVLLGKKAGAEFGEMIGCAGIKKCEKAIDLPEMLGALLPRYMVPRKIVEFDELPRNDRGKIDRFALRRLLHEREGYSFE